MKDRQAERSGQLHGIPIISPCLHCVAMSAIVFLRSSFGIDYLRPKAIFLTFCILTAQLAFISWFEPYLKPLWIITLYCVTVSVLYTAHLIIVISKQKDPNAEHDQFSGYSHLLRLMPATAPGGRGHSQAIQVFVRLWLEPGLVFVAALVFRVIGEWYLSVWLLFVAVCFWFKELINYWLEIRREKTTRDKQEDVEETVPLDHQAPEPPPVGATPGGGGRVPGTKRPRPTVQSVEEEIQQEENFARILRMMQPYTLQQAEDNFRALIKQKHADVAGDSQESHRDALELNEAIAYFRQKFGKCQ